MFEPDEDRIAERIKDFIKNEKSPNYTYIMLRNGRILDIDDYYDMVSTGKVNPQDAYVYIRTDLISSRASFYYPFLGWDIDFLDAYLSKLGFHYKSFVVPATGLKYVANAKALERYLSMEVSNLDIIVNNLNLPKIVLEVLGDKIISGERELTGEEYDKILNMLKSQRPFAGHNVSEVFNIIDSYYHKGNRLLAKEVFHIAMDYDRIFHPYRVCYETRTWKEIDCWSIKL